MVGGFWLAIYWVLAMPLSGGVPENDGHCIDEWCIGGLRSKGRTRFLASLDGFSAVGTK